MIRSASEVTRLRADGGPEAAFVGEVADGAALFREVAAEGVEGVGPAGGGEVFEDFGAIGEVHESAAGFVFEVAVAEVDEARVLVAAFPAEFFEAPEGALGGRHVAVVRGEEERCAGAADGVEFAEGSAAVVAAGDLHE
jgi:hypothetical protein